MSDALFSKLTNSTTKMHFVTEKSKGKQTLQYFTVFNRKMPPFSLPKVTKVVLRQVLFLKIRNIYASPTAFSELYKEMKKSKQNL